MPLLEDNPSKEVHALIERFEQTVGKLLETHANYQKQIRQLTEENQALRSLLKDAKNSLHPSPLRDNTPPPLDHTLVHQLNKYIKEIDLCLDYFQQA